MSISPKCSFSPSFRFFQVPISPEYPFPPSSLLLNSPFFPSAQCPFLPRIYLLRCPFFLSAHFLQELICYGDHFFSSPIPQLPISPNCLFPHSAHFSRIPICTKCPFRQLPIFSNCTFLPKFICYDAHFLQVTICSCGNLS